MRTWEPIHYSPPAKKQQQKTYDKLEEVNNFQSNSCGQQLNGRRKPKTFRLPYSEVASTTRFQTLRSGLGTGIHLESELEVKKLNAATIKNYVHPSATLFDIISLAHSMPTPFVGSAIGWISFVMGQKMQCTVSLGRETSTSLNKLEKTLHYLVSH